ncbi:MAG: hypothetical protein AAB573_02335 [Patescibacteria group bacterium]
MKTEQASGDWLDVASPLVKAQAAIDALNLKPKDLVTFEDRGKDGRLYSLGVRRNLKVLHVYRPEGVIEVRINEKVNLITGPFNFTKQEGLI